MHKWFLFCLPILLFAQVAFAQDAKTPAEICAGAVPAADPANRQFSAPDQALQPGVDYRAIFCTEVGPIYVDLLEKYTPITVNNFVFLSQQGYYNNTTFHRVIQDFMAQGGDPTGTGTGSPGYTIPDEFVGFLHFDQPGWLAMANTGQPNSGGGQFFITTAPYPSLDYQYTIFGQVLEGQDNVKKIRIRDPQTATQPGTKLDTVVIITDPSTVKTTYVAPKPATREDIAKIIDDTSGQLPSALTVDKEVTGIFDTAQVAQTAPDALRSDYQAFLEKYHHQFRAEDRITNAACDLKNIQFMAISYTLDRFDTPEDASAALQDPFLPKLEAVNGYTQTTVKELNYPLYTQTRKACDTDATLALTMWQRGHFVVTATALIPTNSPAPPERWLRDLVGVSTYERIFSDVLRREIR